jgi:hypothetical protein
VCISNLVKPILNQTLNGWKLQPQKFERKNNSKLLKFQKKLLIELGGATLKLFRFFE